MKMYQKFMAAAAMALLIGVGSCTSDVSAKDADGNIVIVIDPGHGGTDPGKQGINGVLESDANYAIAEAMMDELKNYSGVKVYFTRPEDSLVTLTGRAMAAAELDADFLAGHFISSLFVLKYDLLGFCPA